MWANVKRLVRRLASNRRCAECGQTDSTVQVTSGRCTTYVCRTCIQRFDYDFYQPSLRENV